MPGHGWRSRQSLAVKGLRQTGRVISYPAHRRSARCVSKKSFKTKWLRVNFKLARLSQ
jgi:hypothetical protein